MKRVERVIVGEIGRPHGVRGLTRLRAFTADPMAMAGYGPLTDEAGTRHFAVTVMPDGIARIEGVADRDQAAKLTGVKLFAERDRMPPPEDPEEFFLVDLEGLAAVTEDGATLGTVRAVEDYGGGAILVVVGAAGEILLPFTKAVVPVVDLAGGRVVVALPAEVVVPPQPGEEAVA